MQLACDSDMRIAQVAPLYESVPPKAYGGTERVVHVLTEELVAMGHEVTLFASGDSATSAQLVPICPRSLRLDPECEDPYAWQELALALVAKEHARFDVVHFHLDYHHFSLSRALALPNVTTLHGRLDLPGLAELYEEFKDMPLVSISDDQRTPLPNARWLRTIHHGLRLGPDTFNASPADYLVFVGRLSREKRPDRAIAIAGAVGMKLKVAAKIDDADRAYYERELLPLFEQPHVEFLGELDEPRKLELMGKAKAFLMPVDWPEPFGLVAIEAMACGTPVLAFRQGAMPEVIEEGVSGVLVDDVPEAIAAMPRLLGLPRAGVRQAFDRHFTARRMADEYVEVYEYIARSSNRTSAEKRRVLPGERAA
jgi:glycosyltransferase involved in cell wall biosynthesis